MSLMEAIKTESANTNLVNTENGALGYASASSAIVDFFYKVSSMRNMDAPEKRLLFLRALAEDRELAIRMLFFIRDIRGGMGERQLFRDIFNTLDQKEVKVLFKLIPEFGRWDDVIDLLRHPEIDREVNDEILRFIQNQFNEDLKNCDEGKSISLLAKWLPSIRKVSKDKVVMAKFLASSFGITEKEYRKALSKLRGYLNVVEKKMTSDKWTEIEYGGVPSKAAKNYREAFRRHDSERYEEYLNGLKKGTEKVNAGAIYPYEIVHEYARHSSYSYSCDLKHVSVDPLLESQWNALPVPTKGLLSNAIVVRDGSGSMLCTVSGTSTALDVATSLAILLSQNLKGEFKDRFITFSNHPRFIDLSGASTLKDKIDICMQEAEVANTNIEATMRLILKAVIKDETLQEDIPAVVIVSDMEFDQATHRHDAEVLFEGIAKEWAAEGYKLPKIVFWNVNSRTGAVPMQENESGLLLVSGFSQNILGMLSENGSMLDVIRKKVMDKRYDCISQALELATVG